MDRLTLIIAALIVLTICALAGFHIVSILPEGLDFVFKPSAIVPGIISAVIIPALSVICFLVFLLKFNINKIYESRSFRIPILIFRMLIQLLLLTLQLSFLAYNEKGFLVHCILSFITFFLIISLSVLILKNRDKIIAPAEHFAYEISVKGIPLNTILGVFLLFLSIIIPVTLFLNLSFGSILIIVISFLIVANGMNFFNIYMLFNPQNTRKETKL